MAVYKDNATGRWRVIYRFTNWKGERKQTQKRGFATKREALAWEHEAMLKQGAKLDMTFGSFFEVYEADKKQRVKESTWESKSHVIRTKILPYFENRKIAEIEAKDVIAWQNELMAYKDEKGKPYSADYLRTIHAQLTAIFNHAVNFYNLPYNPARRAGTIGSEAVKEMDFWTKEEYLALEDDFQRIQSRMFMMYGVNDTDRLHFATAAGKIGNRLDEQLENFVREHPDTKLIIIDTMQKIREVGGEAYSYASDYEIIGKLKQFADKHCICVLTVHHTRMQPAGDSFEMISGSAQLDKVYQEKTSVYRGK